MTRVPAILLFLLVGFASVMLSGRAWGQDMPARDRQVVLVSGIKVKAGQEARFEAAVRDFYAAVSRGEPGCLVNIMYRPAPPPGGKTVIGQATANRYVFYEIYRDPESARTHPKTPHFQHFMTVAAPLMDGPIDLQFLEEAARRSG